nr:phage portal protein [uncultured Pseudodesulfovibrio sp.]
MHIGTFLYHSWTGIRSQIMALRNPQAAIAYIADRNRYLSYKAASKHGANRAWRGDRRSADATIAMEWRDVVARARDLAKNSPFVAGAIEKICDNVVFTGIRPQFVLTDAEGKVSRELCRKKARKLERLHKRWAKAVNMVEKQELGLRHLWTDGEYLIHYFIDTSLMVKGLPPLNYELLEADHIDTSVHGQLRNGHMARRGIEYDKSGNAVAYHIYPEHPGHSSFLSRQTDSIRVDATSIEHVFARKRISQSRGMSWLAPIIMHMRNFDEYQDSEQTAMRLLSAFGFFIETPLGDLENPLGGIPSDSESEAADKELKSGDFIETGQIVTVPVGSKVNAAGYDRPGSNYEPWIKSQLRGGGVGMSLSYESFTGDLTETTYSGGRQGMLVERRAFQRQQAVLNRKHNEPINERFVEFAALGGFVNVSGFDVDIEHLNPGWPWVDPRNDAQAAKLELELGITTLTKLCADRGMDFEEITQKRKEELDVLISEGLEGNAEAMTRATDLLVTAVLSRLDEIAANEIKEQADAA